jgi:hypothetical protein
MPCQNCLGRTTEDSFKTLSAFDFNCCCGDCFHVDLKPSASVSDFYLISLDEFRQFYDLVPNLFIETRGVECKNHHLSEFLTDLDGITEEECDLFEKKIGRGIEDYADYISLYSINNVEVYSKFCPDLCGTGFSSTSLFWRLKEGVVPEFNLDDLLVIDAVGHSTDVFLRKNYLSSIISNTGFEPTYLKVNDHYLSPLLWSAVEELDLYEKKEAPESILSISDNALQDETVEIFFSDLEKLSVDNGVFKYSKNDLSFTFEFLEENRITCETSDSEIWEGFISAIKKSDALEVQGFDELHYLVGKDYFVNNSDDNTTNIKLFFREGTNRELLLAEDGIKTIRYNDECWFFTLKESDEKFYIIPISLLPVCS